jgi:hypothetical protein
VSTTFDRWNLDTGATEESETMTAAVEKTHPEVVIVPLAEEDIGDFLSWNTNSNEGVLKRHSKQVP